MNSHVRMFWLKQLKLTSKHLLLNISVYKAKPAYSNFHNKSYQSEKADMAVVAFFTYPAAKIIIELYHISKLSRIEYKHY
jgi:hypothetical protein